MTGDRASIVRTHAWDRYIATLFAPADKREALFALYALDIEISRICDLVHDPLPGEIRLQWWRDVANGQRDGEASGHPVASALLKTIKDYDLPHTAFDAYCEARIFEFYQDVMPDQTALEASLGATHSSIIQLAAMILDGDAAKLATDAAGHAGVALGLAQIIARFSTLHRRRQGFVPESLLQALGTSSEAFFNGDDTAKGNRVFEALIALSQDHLAKYVALKSTIPASLKPAFLPLAPVSRLLKAASRNSDSLNQPVAVSQFTRMVDILRGAMGSSKLIGPDPSLKPISSANS